MRVRILVALLGVLGLTALACGFIYQGQTSATRGVAVETECGVRVLGDCAVTAVPEDRPILAAAEGKVVGYEGEQRDGKRHGFGTVTWENGNTYSGEWHNDVPHGRGRFTAADGQHEGEWRNGKAHGLGMATWRSGARYFGEWRDGKLDGRGTLTFANGNRYEGEWRATRMSGQGRGTWIDGSSYDGAWQEDWPHGAGTYIVNGVSHTGNWNAGCLKVDGQIIAVVRTHQDCHFLLERPVAAAERPRTGDRVSEARPQPDRQRRRMVDLQQTQATLLD
jgi:hypothetical protein